MATRPSVPIAQLTRQASEDIPDPKPLITFNKTVTKTALLNLLVETFFAVLPLFVLSAVWTRPSASQDNVFWYGPEVSMTSCILYGLSLARLLQGAVFAGRKSHSNGDIHQVAAGYAFLLLFPLFGVIVSVILISKSMQFPVPNRSIANLAIAVFCFIILGGHGVKLTEGSAVE
jgi:hypothetical protein